MIGRYTLKEMGKVWSKENRYVKWLEVEIAVCEGMAKYGCIPSDAVEKIKERARVDIERIDAFEKLSNHEVIAFLDALKESVGDEARYIHLGLTSSDIMDTGLALQLMDASKIIQRDIDNLQEILREQAMRYKNTIMIGRTHGIHAQPITLGLKFALWWEEMERNRQRMERAAEIVRYGKISGAVGTYTHISPQIEEFALKKLDLEPSPISTQVIQRDRHAEYLLILALIASSVEKFALEVRHLQRTEVREVEEPFTRTQKGSSAMPHKRNPILCERICGLTRIVKTNGLLSLDNIPLWHERDISHSSVERVTIPDSCVLLDYILQKFTFVMDGLSVYPERMRQNLALSGGLVFSQKVLTELINKGMDRETAYELVQKYALKSYDEGIDFQSLISADKVINKYFGRKEIQACFNFSSLLQNVDYIFKRLSIEA